MTDEMNFIDESEDNRGLSSKRRKTFVSATDRLPEQVVREASKEDPTRKGLDEGWKRHTVVVHDDWVTLVEEMTEELSITKMDAWRFLLRLGVRDYLAGERPQLERRPRALNRLAGDVGAQTGG